MTCINIQHADWFCTKRLWWRFPLPFLVYLVYDGPFDMLKWTLLTRRPCIVSYIQVAVEACGSVAWSQFVSFIASPAFLIVIVAVVIANFVFSHVPNHMASLKKCMNRIWVQTIHTSNKKETYFFQKWDNV